MSGGGGRLVYHPAGPDEALRAAVEEVQAGRWMSMRALLAATGEQWGLRTARSQVLATVAARSDVLEAWQREEPGSTDLVVMRARVAVERVFRASRQHGSWSGVLAHEARTVCWQATEAAPADPVPWVCLLALAQLDEWSALHEHQVASPAGSMMPRGPWGLLAEADARDPGSREAHLRMLRFLLARPRGPMRPALDFAQWAVASAPQGSPLLVLPLHVHVANYQRQRARGELAIVKQRHWMSEHILRDSVNARAWWFDVRATEPRTALDLNHLAHALWAGRQMADAARAFDAIGPYATGAPWALVADIPHDPDFPERDFVQARAVAWRSAPATARRT